MVKFWTAEEGEMRAKAWWRRVLKWGWRAVLAYCVAHTALRVAGGWGHIRSGRDLALFLLGMTEDSTLHAGGYSEKAFWEVRPGMSAEEVEGRLGRPLWRREGSGGAEIWAYTSTRGPEDCVTCPDGFYWKRRVVFGADGKVRELDGEYWDD